MPCLLVLSVQSIPSYGHIALQYDQGDSVSNQVFPVTMRAYLPTEAPRFRSDSSPPNSPGSPASWDTAEEFGVDRDLLEEAYEEQHRGTMHIHF